MGAQEGIPGLCQEKTAQTLFYNASSSSSCTRMPESTRHVLETYLATVLCPPLLMLRKENSPTQELPKQPSELKHLVSLLPLTCGQVSSFLVTVGPNFVCQTTTPCPHSFQRLQTPNKKKHLKNSGARCPSLGLSPASYFYLTS